MWKLALLIPLIAPPNAVVPQDHACIIMNERQNPAERASPLDSTTFMIAGQPVKVCYGRPSSKGRTMIGGAAVPYDTLWRTGANEPTMIHTPVALDVAGIKVPPGTYSLYTVPGRQEWQIIINRSTTQWGRENTYNDAVRAQELGRGRVKAESTPAHIETFTIRGETTSTGTVLLILEWERARVAVPIKRG